ncbi:MAG: hypothetical protein KGZ39_03510 [Simkania sp.]|nr:hypothetical protein [Simkania sp.]
MILFRVWYLAVVRHEEYSEKARKPQRRAVVEHIGRASIRDRFNQPLAINRTQFNAAVCYAHVRQIPNFRWETDAQGKRVRVAVRAKYIEAMSKKIAEELDINASQVEDAIHAKASLMPHASFVIAENITEAQYYRLRLMEKDWPGIVAQLSSRRYYPQGKVACDVIGMMGAISAEEYFKIAEELAELEDYITHREAGEIPFLPKGFQSPLEVRDRIVELRQKAYTMRDFVGKSGIEAKFDEELRGFSGKKLFEVDVKGNVIRQLPVALPPMPGQRVILTISAELQEFAESLLAQAEAERCKVAGSLAEPWIKGGAIVAMDAQTGEVLTMASYPRFDPNDFIPLHSASNSHQRLKILEWLENEDRIGEIWDGHAPLEREIYDAKTGYRSERVPLSWASYLEAVLPKKGNLKLFFDRAECLEKILSHQDAFLQESKDRKEDYADRLLQVDLCRLLARSEEFTPQLRAKLGQISCQEYFAERQAFLRLRRRVEEEAKELHNTYLFDPWRAQKFKSFLKNKRLEEKKEKRYPRPYTDYLEQVNRSMFEEFWQNYDLSLIEALLSDQREGKQLPLLVELQEKIQIIKEADPDLQRLAERLKGLSSREKRALFKSFRGFRELTGPLFGYCSRIRKTKESQQLKHLAAAFYPLNGYGYGRSQAFRQSTPAGSIFKLAVAYQALLEQYEALKEQGRTLASLNPLTLIDESRTGMGASIVLGRTAEGSPITRLYKGGRLPRSSHAGIGRVDMIGAIEQSSNVYFSILAAENIKDPAMLTQVAWQFGFGEKSGIELPGEISGNLPRDLAEDKTGIYAYAIGQHSLVVTPLQTAVMMAAVAGDGRVLKPSIIQLKAGREMERDAGELFNYAHFPYQQELGEIGIHFPLFSVSSVQQEHSAVSYSPIQVRRALFYPKEIREMLMEGMRKVVQGSRGSARLSAVRRACSSPQVYRIYTEMAPEFIGKTGTAEILYKQTVDKETKAALHTHTWFAGVNFAKDHHNQIDWNTPQIVVVVYLRFGHWGREVAPLVALMMKKWEDICKKHGGTSYIRPPMDDRLN